MGIWHRLFRTDTYALDPIRAAASRRDFDIERGFDRYAAFCQCYATRSLDQMDSGLAQHGVELLPILSETRAAAVLSDILTARIGVRADNKGIDYSEVLAFASGETLLPLFQEILRERVDAKIAGHFESEYLIYSFSVTRTLPITEARRSFLWHCDRGPRRFLKILLYLNGSEGHGGNTECLDRQTTTALERIGYVFGPNRRRSDNLAPLARMHGISYAPIRWPIKAGEGLLFEPAGTLHRGIMPSRGERYVLSITLVPSPVPWQVAFSITARTRFCETNAGVWPAHSDDLLRIIGIDPGATSSEFQ
jgi:hypothetical protein